ncbi:MAG: hypothetical protein AB7L71_02545 [Vicinamibacterales bacterium]
MRVGQRGIGMLDALFGIVFLGIVLGFALSMMQNNQQESEGRAEADVLSSFIQLSTQYVSSNRTAMESAMDGTGASTYCLIGVAADGTGGTTVSDTTLRTCGFDASFLRKQGLWPTGMPVDFEDGRYVAVWRKVYNGSTATGAIEAVIVHASTSGALTAVSPGDQAARNTKLASGMEAMGGTGGYVPIGDMVACKTERSSSTFEVCGNSWKVNLANFISPAQLATFANALPN